MPIAITEIPSPPPPLQPPRKRWTRAECVAIEKLGVWDQQHLELVEGELISKMGQGRPHVNSLMSLMGWLMQVFGAQFVNANATIDVAPEDNPSNEPEPDIIVLTREQSQFPSANPRPEDLHLAVEIADTSHTFDLTTKAALYARAGIIEYWVLDVRGRRLFVHRDPSSGAYASIVAYDEHESVAPLAAPHAEFRVAGAFS